MLHADFMLAFLRPSMVSYSFAVRDSNIPCTSSQGEVWALGLANSTTTCLETTLTGYVLGSAFSTVPPSYNSLVRQHFSFDAHEGNRRLVASNPVQVSGN